MFVSKGVRELPTLIPYLFCYTFGRYFVSRDDWKSNEALGANKTIFTKVPFLMKDSILLLISGLVCAGLAWLFFNFFQHHAFTILFLIAVASITYRFIRGEFRCRHK